MRLATPRLSLRRWFAIGSTPFEILRDQIAQLSEVMPIEQPKIERLRLLITIESRQQRPFLTARQTIFTA